MLEKGRIGKTEGRERKGRKIKGEERERKGIRRSEERKGEVTEEELQA